jgi:hypothetical protein
MNLIRQIEDYFKRRQLIAAVAHRPNTNIIEVTYNGHTLVLITQNIVEPSSLYGALDSFVEANRA